MNVPQKQAARKFVEYWTFQRGSERRFVRRVCLSRDLLLYYPP